MQRTIWVALVTAVIVALQATPAVAKLALACKGTERLDRVSKLGEVDGPQEAASTIYSISEKVGSVTSLTPALDPCSGIKTCKCAVAPHTITCGGQWHSPSKGDGFAISVSSELTIDRRTGLAHLQHLMFVRDSSGPKSWTTSANFICKALTDRNKF